MNVDENELTAKVCTPCKGGILPSKNAVNALYVLRNSRSRIHHQEYYQGKQNPAIKTGLDNRYPWLE